MEKTITICFHKQYICFSHINKVCFMVCLCFGSKGETSGRSWPEPLLMHKKMERVIAEWLRNGTAGSRISAPQKDWHAYCTHKSLKKNYKNMSETQHFWEKPFYSFDMNRKNLADYFHRINSLKHLAETNRKTSNKAHKCLCRVLWLPHQKNTKETYYFGWHKKCSIVFTLVQTRSSFLQTSKAFMSLSLVLS